MTSDRPDSLPPGTTIVKIGLANDKIIREWSSGEITETECFDPEGIPTLKGLFCRGIFGPLRDYICLCGHLYGQKNKGKKCNRCDTKVESSNVRRQRMGHIELAAPVVHPLFFLGNSFQLSILLCQKKEAIKNVVLGKQFVITKVMNGAPFTEGHIIKEKDDDDDDVHILDDPAIRSLIQIKTGVEAILWLLKKLDLESTAKDLRQKLAKTKSKMDKQKTVRHLRLVESLLRNGITPEWLVLETIPVIPPDLRPRINPKNDTTKWREILAGKSDKEKQPKTKHKPKKKETKKRIRFPVDDLNELYRRIIKCNKEIKISIENGETEEALNKHRLRLQKAVNALFDNNLCKPPVRRHNSPQPLKSLADRLKSKQGRFRENLLGKRVDFSGRSVIVPGPNLLLHQCGLPKEIAVGLYRPFLVLRLKEHGVDPTSTIVPTKKAILGLIQERNPIIWEHLEEVMREFPAVILNRAPTLHRMNVQAFEPILTDEKVIRLHPLVCRGFNADFDGDQMAVHLPVSDEAQKEANTLLLSTHNLFSPANGTPIVAPSQDIVMGCYYATLEIPGSPGEGMALTGRNELFQALDRGLVNRHTRIRIRMPNGRQPKTGPKIEEGKSFETTVGRFLFNDILPEKMPYYNETLKSGGLVSIIRDCRLLLGHQATIDFLDRLMRFGFEECTRSGMSFILDDLVELDSKKAMIEKAEGDVAQVRQRFEDGLLHEKDRYSEVVDIWTQVRNEISIQMKNKLEQNTHSQGCVNPIHAMVVSGARGGMEQVRQLAGMRGLMAKPNGKIVETPVKSSFREGLSIYEFFLSVHGARKGLSDSAVRTAEAGYLTRRLVFAAQSVIVTCRDCETSTGVLKKPILNSSGDVSTKLSEQVYGRISCSDIIAPGAEKPFVRQNELISVDAARALDKHAIESIRIRSPLTCKAENGICAMCYGIDLSTSGIVEEGMAVGTIAAQSIGEPGTQLTLRTFHTGGTANESKDITGGFPRIEALFAARRPKKAAVISKTGGTVRLEKRICKKTMERKSYVVVANDERKVDHYIQPGKKIVVKSGDIVSAGQPLTDGEPVFNHILKIQGPEALAEYVMNELQKIYRGQGIKVDDKHFEVILSQMLYRDHSFSMNESASSEDPVSFRGISKAALQNQSFLARAAFQKINTALAEAAMMGSTDRLTSLIPAVMTGGIVPIGTGYNPQFGTCSDETISQKSDQASNIDTEFHNEQTVFLDFEQDILPDEYDTDDEVLRNDNDSD